MSDSAGRRNVAAMAPLALAVLGVVLARVVARFALEDVPHVMDEIAYTLQARTFASGHLTEAAHLPRAAFAMWFVDDRERYFSIFPPGWPAVLSLGYRTGLASWVNPLLHGATTLVLARAAGVVAGKRAATLAAALYALSPQAILVAASFMSHALVAFTAAVVLAVGVRMLAKGEPPRLPTLLAAGTALGLSAATRPLCAVVLLVTLALFALVALRRGRLRLVHVAALGAPALVFLALLGGYNAHLTGSMLRFPQTAFFDQHAPPVDLPLFTYHPGCNSLGFGHGHGCEAGVGGAGHSLKNALSNLGDNLTAWLWLAGGGPLAFGLAIFGAALRGDPGERTARLVTFAAIPSTLVLYGLYWYAGTCYGARFYQVALPALLVLAALGLDRLARSKQAWFRAAITLVLLWNGFFGVRGATEIARSYWGTDARFARLAAGWTDQDALILVAFTDEDLRGHYDLTTFMRDVIWLKNIRSLGALAVNSPDPEASPVIFARYHPGLVRGLRERFPRRKLHLYTVGVHQPDRLMPYSATGLGALEQGAAPPLDNFDAFIVPQ